MELSKCQRPEGGHGGMKCQVGVITSESTGQLDEGPELCSGSPEMQVDSRQLTWALGRGEGLSEWESIAS